MLQNCQLSMLRQVTSDVSECMSVIYVISYYLSATLSQASRAGGDVPEPSSFPREDGEVGRGHERLRPQHQAQQQVSRLAAQSWTKRTRPRMCMKDYLHRYGKALDRRSKLHRKQAHLQAGGEEGMKARICHLRKVTRTKI